MSSMVMDALVLMGIYACIGGVVSLSGMVVDQDDRPITDPPVIVWVTLLWPLVLLRAICNYLREE